MNSIKRNIYLDRIIPFIDKHLIKVIVGQRRTGKSHILKQIMALITSSDAFTHHIIYINKEDFEFDFINDYQDLIKYVEQKSKKSKNLALFIDEIQEIRQFEKALIHFHTKEKYDIYCSGSNARLLSGELSTLLSGRYIEFNIYSLTFPEFLDFHQLKYNQDSFDKYMIYGGMPYLLHLNFNDEMTSDYLRSLYNTIVVKDVITRHAIRNVSFLQNLTVFIADNTGSIISAKKISDYLKSQHMKISSAVIQDYLSFLSDAIFIHKVRRSDLQGKRIFEINEKYYFNDVGMRNSIVGYKVIDIGKMLENIVFIHLKVAGYKITVGVDRNKEIDFVAQKENELLYVQVCYLLKEQSTVKREFGNLQKIKNNYPKMVVSADPHTKTSYQGIKHLNIKEFCFEILKLKNTK